MGLALWANLTLQASSCQGRPLEVPFAFEGAWAAEDRGWISQELLSWFASHGREGCEATSMQQRLVLVLRDDATVSLQLRRNSKVAGERVLAVETVPLEGRTYAVAALAEELARSLWERPIRREVSVGAVGTTRILYSAAKLVGGGLQLGWSPIDSLAFELGVTAASNLSVRSTNGTTGGMAVWAELGMRYALVALGPLVFGPRVGFDLGRLFLWGVDTAGLRRDGAAWWVVGRGGVFLGFEQGRWALRLCGSMGRTLAGTVVLDGADRAQVLDGAVGEVSLAVEVRF